MEAPEHRIENIRWKTVKIPEKVFKRIQRVCVFTGCPSVAETMNQMQQSAAGQAMIADAEKNVFCFA